MVRLVHLVTFMDLRGWFELNEPVYKESALSPELCMAKPLGQDAFLVFLHEVFLKITKPLKACFSGISPFPKNLPPSQAKLCFSPKRRMLQCPLHKYPRGTP